MVCAIVLTVIAVRGQIIGPPIPVGVPLMEAQGNWRDYASSGQRLGPAEAPVALITFSDFQCPGCRVLSQHLAELQRTRHGDFAVMYRHFPLPMHAAAGPAAAASICAGNQGRFAAMHDSLFARQRTLSETPWSELAAAVGVKDIEAFDRCLTDTETIRLLAVDSASAKELKAAGTPTVLVAGVRFAGVPSIQVLDSLISVSLASGGPPQRRKLWKW